MPKKIDLTGQTFGRLTVMYELLERKNGKVQWHCKCECGNEKDVISTQLTGGRTQSCGCLQKERTSEANSKGIDLTGQTFGRLTVLHRSPNSAKWVCQCECGNKTEVTTTHLRTGHSKSCGCLQRDKASETHGINLTHKRFGMLTVQGLNLEKSTTQVKYWNCLCDCGNSTVVPTGALRSGSIQTCGCKKMSHGEIKIASLLDSYNIPYTREQTFESCINPATGRPLRFDFYVNRSYLIEFDGKQHFEQTSWEPLEDIQCRDALKDAWCKENKIPLIRIPYTKLDTLNINDLLP